MPAEPGTHEPACATHREAWLRLLLDSTAEGIFGLDLEGRCTLANRSAVELLGFEDEHDLLGKPLHDLIHYADPDGSPLPRHSCAIGRSLRAATRTHNDEDVFWRRGGTSFPVEYWSYPLEEGGRLSGVVVAFVDITERRKASEDLRRSEQSLANAQRIARLGNWDLDLVTNRLHWSDEIYRIFGLVPRQFGATYDAFLECVHPADRTLVKQGVERAMRQEAGYSIDHRIVWPDGTERLVHEQAEVTFDAAGRPLRMSGTVQDVTEQKEAERALLRKNRALKTLSSCNVTLVRAAEVEQLLTDMCRIIVQTGGYRVAWVGLSKPEEPGALQLKAHFGLEEEERFADLVRRVETLASVAARAGTVQVLPEPRDLSPARWPAMAALPALGSAVAFPLTDPSGVFGALSIYASEPRAFDQEEIHLLSELAEDLAYGISTLRMRAAHQENGDRLERSMRKTIQAMANIVEIRDPYTAGHQRRVAQLAEAIAREMGLSDERIQGLHLAGIVHDIGKIQIPAEILSKPGRLTDVEFRFIQLHAQAGYEILKDVEFPWPIADIVCQHHERLDGTGYPNGLRGDAILLEAQILSVADVVEAMASHRPYRPGLGIEAALAEITRLSGVFFRPEAVEACLALFREQGYRLEA